MWGPDGGEGTQAVCELQVSTTLQPRRRRHHLTSSPQDHLLLCKSPKYMASPNACPELRLPLTHFGVQSKACQKGHWKALHKVTCPGQATIRQNLRESHQQKEWSKKIDRWMNVWADTITCCSPAALDLANHEWGRHDTHRYVLSAVLVRSF